MDNSAESTNTYCKTCGTILKSDLDCPNCLISRKTIAEPWQDILDRAKEVIPPAHLFNTTASHRYQLKSTICKIGRDRSNQIVIDDDPYVSRFHGLVNFEDGRFFIEDLGSTNGILLNGSPLIRRRPLVNGDRIRIGRCDLVFIAEATSPDKTMVKSNQASPEGR